MNIFFRCLKILVISLTLNACGHRLPELETELNNALLERLKEDTLVVRLDTINHFEWDELLVAKPYSNLQDILDYDLVAFPSNATSYDQYLFLGFINDKKGVHWISLVRNRRTDSLFESSREGYKIYSKSECYFSI